MRGFAVAVAAALAAAAGASAQWVTMDAGGNEWPPSGTAIGDDMFLVTSNNGLQLWTVSTGTRTVLSPPDVNSSYVVSDDSAIVYDSSRDVAWIMGGGNAGTRASPLRDASTGSRFFGTHVTITDRKQQCAHYFPLLDRIVVYGGNEGFTRLGLDVFHPTTFAVEAVTESGTVPANRYNQGCAADLQNNRLFVFGGRADADARVADFHTFTFSSASAGTWAESTLNSAYNGGQADGVSLAYAQSDGSIHATGGCCSETSNHYQTQGNFTAGDSITWTVLTARSQARTASAYAVVPVSGNEWFAEHGGAQASTVAQKFDLGAIPVAPTTGVATTGVATTGVATTGVATTGVATTGVATTGVATTGVATTGVATTGVATTGVATTGVATTGVATTGVATTGVATTGVATTGVATTGVATTGVATTGTTTGVAGTTGVATTGVATTGVATTGVATTGVATTGVATTGVATTGVATTTAVASTTGAVTTTGTTTGAAGNGTTTGAAGNGTTTGAATPVTPPSSPAPSSPNSPPASANSGEGSSTGGGLAPGFIVLIVLAIIAGLALVGCLVAYGLGLLCFAPKKDKESDMSDSIEGAGGSGSATPEDSSSYDSDELSESVTPSTDSGSGSYSSSYTSGSSYTSSSSD